MKLTSIHRGFSIIGLSVLLLFVVLSACSKENADASKSAPAAQNAGAPNTSMQSAAPAATQSLQGDIPKSGKVIKAMHAGGYTYMQLENGGREFWIAATMMNVKRDDQVAWADAALMKNFKSPSLRRTFDEILFVSNASVQ